MSALFVLPVLYKKPNSVEAVYSGFFSVSSADTAYDTSGNKLKAISVYL